MKFTLDKCIIIICVVLYSPAVKAQSIEAMSAKTLMINYEKTLHILFPSDIKYFNVGNEDVVGDNPSEARNILRLKANVEKFTGKTNISVVTADGKYYPYMVAYSDSLSYTYVDLKDEYRKPSPITVSTDKYVHLIFPYRVKYIDFGNTTISVERAESVDNIIKIKAEEESFPETNVSVVTENGRFYTFNVEYAAEPASLSYVVDNTDKNKEVALIDENNEMNNADKEKLEKAIVDRSGNMRLRQIKNKIVLSIENIFIRRNILFFKMSIDNRSTIDYDIDLMRFYIHDKKITKKTAVQQIIQEPLFMMKYKKQIPAKHDNIFIVAFEKFTIPDKKNFIIELQENNGGRHFLFKIDNRTILHAETVQIK